MRWRERRGQEKGTQVGPGMGGLLLKGSGTLHPLSRREGREVGEAEGVIADVFYFLSEEGSHQLRVRRQSEDL